jgi:hypothetical protein
MGERENQSAVKSSPVNGQWRTSSYSAGGDSECVEVANSAESVLVRDSKDICGVCLRFSRSSWTWFRQSL